MNSAARIRKQERKDNKKQHRGTNDKGMVFKR
jgi:hypothetical protein